MMTLNGMFAEPKPHRINFIKENKRKLKQIASMVNQSTKYSKVDVSKSQSSQTDVAKSVHSANSKHKDIKTSGSGCRTSGKGGMAVFVQEKKEDTGASNSSITTATKSSHKSISLCRNQSCQTIDPKRYDQLFHEGIIKYPSNKVMQELALLEQQRANRLDAHVKKEFLKKNKVRQKSATQVPKPPLKETGRGDIRDPSEEEEEEPVIQNAPPHPPAKPKPPPPLINASEIIRKTTEDHINYSPRGTVSQRSSGGYTTDRAPNNYGDVKASNVNQTSPKGKKTVSKKGKTEEDEILKTIMDPMCPPGHIPLPDQERKKTLHMLRVSYAELVREMNMLPVRTDTLRVRQRKIQLENQLNKIEEGIKVFNKSKVYVKIEE